MIPANNLNRSSDRELVMTRVLDAPRALVFAMWTEPAHMKRWWGPRGYSTLSSDVDLRPGGAWRVASRHTDGSETAERGVFREIAEPERLVFTHAWEGGKQDGETVVTVTLAERQGKTTMTFHQAVFGSVAVRDGHAEGWGESFDMLAEYLGEA